MESVLKKNIPFRFTAPGISMTPFIRDGDVITIEPVAIPLRRGDVVAFVNPFSEKLTVHRIINISQAGYLIKGDNISDSDGRVPFSSIIGRVACVEHCGQKVWLGIGFERIIIAWLSQHGLLPILMRRIWPLIKPLLGKWF